VAGAGSHGRGTSRARRQARVLAAVVLVVCAVAPVFNILTVEASVGSAFQGLLDGFLVSILVGSYLLFVRDGLLRDGFRRLSFSANLAISGSILVAIFLLARGAGQVITSGEPARFVESFGDAHLLYALPFFVGFAFVLQFVVQVNRMIGTNAKRTGHEIVASGALLDRLTLPAGVVARLCEELTLRGKEERVTAYALEDGSISRKRTAIHQ
jgi:hypothetical protein